MTIWTILRTAHPESSNLTLPSEVYTMLHLDVALVATRSKLERTLVFLWRPRGWLRVVPSFYFAELVAKEAGMGRILTQAPFTGTSTGSMVMNLPLRAVHYLHLKDFEGANPSPRTPMDSIAWVAPKDNWEAVLAAEEAARVGRPGPRGVVPHVYLARNAFEGTLPTLAELEDPKARPKPETLSVRIGPTPPRKDQKRDRASRPYG